MIPVEKVIKIIGSISDYDCYHIERRLYTKNHSYFTNQLKLNYPIENEIGDIIIYNGELGYVFKKDINHYFIHPVSFHYQEDTILIEINGNEYYINDKIEIKLDKNQLYKMIEISSYESINEMNRLKDTIKQKGKNDENKRQLFYFKYTCGEVRHIYEYDYFVYLYTYKEKDYGFPIINNEIHFMIDRVTNFNEIPLYLNSTSLFYRMNAIYENVYVKIEI